MAEKKQNDHGVVITVYVESSTSRSKKQSDQTTKKTQPQTHFRRPGTAATQGYDRRAQLLAYSRQLRHAAPGDALDEFSSKSSEPKAKVSSLLSLALCSSRIKSMFQICQFSSRNAFG